MFDTEFLDGRTILITGGTGSFGRTCAEYILRHAKPEKLIIFSRDEAKQYEMSQTLSVEEFPSLRYFLGDVRDESRLRRAFDGVDFVIHAAALKQVPACEYNPFEAVKTNILGAQNIINVAIDAGVKRVLALSTDKAASPVNLYGATKLCADKLFTSGNVYSGFRRTRFSIVRYGNVMGSRGSVIPLFQRLRATGELPITDARMTRFWITLDQGVRFVLRSMKIMQGGELFVPKIPSMRIVDLAAALAPECTMKFVGIRPGEKLHETLITEDDGRHTLEFPDHFVIEPEFHWWSNEEHVVQGGRPLTPGFVYASNTNDRWLTAEELHQYLAESQFAVA